MFQQNKENNSQSGFTLMEIVVSTTIFALVTVAMTSLFNYTLKINRRSEAIRQAAQGARDFTESLVKDVRNGEIAYGVINGNATDPAYPSPCVAPTITAGVPAATYSNQENKIGIITAEGEEECIYLGYGPGAASGNALGSYVGASVYTKNTDSSSGNYNPNPVLVLQKNGLSLQILNPPNFRVDSAQFFIRPLKDPYAGSSYSKVQPFVTMVLGFVAQLPTGETVPLYYQTSVSTAKYDVPNQ